MNFFQKNRDFRVDCLYSARLALLRDIRYAHCLSRSISFPEISIKFFLPEPVLSINVLQADPGDIH